MSSNFWAYAGLALLSWILVGLYRSLANRVGVLDQPTARSSHQHVIVSGAGIVLAAMFAAVLMFLVSQNYITVAAFSLFALTSCVAIVGWLDDRYHLGIRLRLTVYALLAFACVAIVGVQPFATMVAAILFVITFANLYNFMDGIDGLAIGQLMFCCMAAAWLLQFSTTSVLTPLCISLTAIASGALLWNWPPAKIFIGDAGSIFFGLSLAVMAVYSAHEGSLHFVTWLILFATFISDSATTLLARAIAGDKIYQAHCTHLYQLLAQRTGSHALVTTLYMLVNFVYLLPLAVLTEHNALHWYFYLAAAYLPLVVIVYSLREHLLSFKRNNL